MNSDTNKNVQTRNSTSSSSKKEDQSSVFQSTPVIACQDVPSTHTSSYPTADFQKAVQGRTKHKLGNHFGLTNFGVNYTVLAPAETAAAGQEEGSSSLSSSALQHYHSKQDEFVMVLEGTAVLCFGEERHLIKAGECMGFPAGQPIGHCITNESTTERVVYLEVGDRSPDDEVHYPNNDLKAVPDPQSTGGGWKFTHKDGTPYE